MKHGVRGTRGWKKRHLGVDGSGVIVAHVLTEATVDDATVGIDLIGAAAWWRRQRHGGRGDTVAFYEAASARHAGGGAADQDGEGVAPRTTLEGPRTCGRP